MVEWSMEGRKTEAGSRETMKEGGRWNLGHAGN